MRETMMQRRRGSRTIVADTRRCPVQGGQRHLFHLHYVSRWNKTEGSLCEHFGTCCCRSNAAANCGAEYIWSVFVPQARADFLGFLPDALALSVGRGRESNEWWY